MKVVTRPPRGRRIDAAGLPKDWRIVRLADVAETRLGKMLDAQKNRGTPFPYLANPNVRWFDIDLKNLKEMPFEEAEEEKFSIRDGDILICEGGEAGRAAIWVGPDIGVKFQKAIHRVRPKESLHNRYLVHRLFYDYHSGNLNDYYTGATIKHLTGQDLARYEIPLPPLDEQKRIAAILDQADALRRLRQRAIDRLNALGQAIFYEMFGEELTRDPADMVALSDILDFTNGVNFSGDQKGQEGCLVLDVLNMYSDTIYPDLTSLYRVRGLRNIEMRLLQKGDVLFVRSSLKEEGVGWPVLFAGHSEPVAFCGFIIRGRPIRFADSLQPHFLIHYLRQPKVRKQMIASSGKVAITNINQTRLGEIRIPIPVAEKQAEFSERIAIIENLISASKREVFELSSLFSSLQHRAFSGQL